MASQYYDSFFSSDIILSDDLPDDITSAPSGSNTPHFFDNEPRPQVSFVQAKKLLKEFTGFEPCNSPKTLYHFEATANSVGVQKRVVHLIASATKKVANGDAGQLTKSLFFVNHIRDTVYLRISIIQWLVEFGFEEADVAPRIDIYHGELTDTTRSRKQARFATGEIRIVVCTVSFATGVNPPGVQLVCQIGRCSPSDAIQKGGQGGRQGGGKPEEESIFIWIVPMRIIGVRANSIGQQTAPLHVGGRRTSSYSQQSQSQPQQESQTQPFGLRLQSTTRADLDGHESDSSMDSMATDAPADHPGLSSPATTRRPKKIKQLTDAEWRAAKTFDGEWELWNSNKCFRQQLFAPFAECLADSCNGCNAPTCGIGDALLPQLPAAIDDEATLPGHRKAVKKALEALRDDIGERYKTSILHPFACSGKEPGEWILGKRALALFVRRYPAVSRGKLFEWEWEDPYGERLVDAVRRAIDWKPSPAAAQTPLPAAAQTPLPATVQTAPLASLTRKPMRGITNTIRLTPRGSVSKPKKKGTGGLRRAKSRFGQSET
jgi:hypothetical protein